MTFPVSTPICSELTGATVRQLQYLDERGALCPGRLERKRRAWDQLDALAVLIFLEVRDRGMRLSIATRLLERLRGSMTTRDLAIWNYALCMADGQYQLHVNSREVVAATKQSIPYILVDVDRLRKRIANP